jgi:asparagine synthase (glutamine-hydrolysing)
VLQDSVQCRVPPDESIGAQLSGGLDSSTVVTLAAELIAASGGRATAFTAVPVGQVDTRFTNSKFGDERSHAASVIERYPNLDHVLIPNNAVPLFQALDSYSFFSQSPVLNTANSPWLYGISKEAQLRGIRVLLQGAVGNLTASFNSQDFVLHSLLAEGRLLDWYRMMTHRHRNGSRFQSDIRSSFGVGPVATALLKLIHSVMPRPATNAASRNKNLYSFSAIRPDFLKSSGLPPSIEDTPFIRKNDSRRTRYTTLQRGDNAAQNARGRRCFGLQIADPTADRRLIEFCFSVPDEAFCQDGRSRSLIRDAMQGRLPEMVRTETRRGLQAADADSLLRENRVDITAEIRRMAASDICNKYLDMPMLTGLIDNWPSGAWPTQEIRISYEIKLLRGLSVGRYMRQMEDGSLHAALR